MTSTEKPPVKRQRSDAGAARQPSSSALRVSALIRVTLAIAIAGAVTAAAIVAHWGPLNATADVIGYPTFADFNPYNYSYAYWLVVGLFPIAALLIFLGLTRIGRRVGLPTPSSRGRIRPVASLREAESRVDPEPSSGTSGYVAAAARVAFVGVVLGLEVGVASNHLWPSVLLVTVGYSLVVGGASVALGWLSSAPSTWDARLATVNALGTPLTVVGLILVSANTGVLIGSTRAVQHYSWFPAWIGVPVAAVLFGWILVAVRRGGAAGSAAVERRTVLLIAAPVALFVLVARLPGDLGPINLFEEGQSVTETMLVGHGWLPWRDVVLTHGLLGDVATTAVSWKVFGDSYWGAAAGESLIFYPLTVVATFYLLVYLVGRSWPAILIAALIFVGTWLGTADARFLLWPVILLLLAALLKRSTHVRAAALGFLVVAQAIVTPEMAPTVLIVAFVVAAYEWYWRPPGSPLAQAFRRTISLVIAITVFSAAFLIYIASRGALGDLVYVTVNLVVGHTLDGAIPPSGAPAGVSAARFDIIALAPVAALLISFAYAVVRLRLRRPFLLADWPMAAVAIFVLFYYTKFLARMDVPHAYEPFMVATPLMIYIIYRAVRAAEHWIRGRLPSRSAGWVSIYPVGIAILLFFVVYFWGPLHTVVDGASAAYRPPVAARPAFARVGYAEQFDGPAFEDLQRIVNAYLGPHDRLMDITDEPALFYYFLDRDPSSRWYAPNGIVDTAELQRNLLAELRRAPPKLIVFDDTDEKMYGLQAMDGVPVGVRLYLISRWILQHYRPLLVSHGRTIYALPGVSPLSRMHLQLKQQPSTTGVRFLGQECSWGYSPTFLGQPAEPPSSAQAVPVRTTVVREPQVILTGWAGDLRAGDPAREVLATVRGRIVGRSTPNIDRPDVVAAGYPAGFLRTGFRLAIPTWANSSKSLKVFAVGSDGSVAQLANMNVPAQGGGARIGPREVVLRPNADTGHVDSEAGSGAVLKLQSPAGSTWRDYRWLQVDAPKGGLFFQGQFQLSNNRDQTDAGRMITFNTLERSPTHYVIPTSSCQQWYGYGSSRLFLTLPPGQQLGAVRLIR